MRIRPGLRHASAALFSALVVGMGTASAAWSQSLVEAMASTYNSNPDLLASRALLRQTDETLAQAVANWRPKITLSAEYNKIEADSIPITKTSTYYILNGKTTLLSVNQPLFRGGKTVADTKTAQANIQAQRARTLYMQKFGEFMSQWDAFVSPTNSQSLTATNLTGHPQVVVPCGFVDGLPLGLLFTGRLYDEGTPMRLAYAYEQATDWHTKHPTLQS